MSVSIQEQRQGGEFTGTGPGSHVRGRSVVAQVMKTGNFNATVDVEARSVYAGGVNDDYWAPFASITDAGVHIFEAPINMEWRLNVTNFTSGNIFWVLESSKNSSFV